MEQFWYAFIPLFVALDGVGLLPVYWSLTHGLNPVERRKAVAEAVVTAFFVGVLFLFVSGSLFQLMGLKLADIMIAGGIILIVLCLRDLIITAEGSPARTSNPGIVPLGVPLLAGPGVLTTILLVAGKYGWGLTLAALVVNLFCVWLILTCSELLLRMLTRHGAQVVSKTFSVILTGYGVMLIRRGLMLVLQP